MNAQSPTGKYQDGDTAPGDFKYIDLNGDGQITDEDRTVIGNGFPTLSYGLNLTASYKNFDFSMNMYGGSRNGCLFLQRCPSDFYVWS